MMEKKGSFVMEEVKQSDFHMSILASGSTGNSVYIETNQIKLLVDAGLSGKKIENLLESIGREAKNLDAILVSHEHSDHIKGVGVLARRYNLPIYANAKTWKAMENKLGKLKTEQKFIFEKEKVTTLADLDISSFGVSHDAVDPQFYSFHKNDKSFVILTDTGYVSDRMRGMLKNADCYLFESNHDVDLLRYGSYPWHLKQRILSNKGHLSNEDGALALAEMVGDNTERIYLGHLSQENNVKDIARMTAHDILTEKDCGVDHQFWLYDTDPAEATSLYTL